MNGTFPLPMAAGANHLETRSDSDAMEVSPSSNELHAVDIMVARSDYHGHDCQAASKTAESPTKYSYRLYQRGIRRSRSTAVTHPATAIQYPPCRV